MREKGGQKSRSKRCQRKGRALVSRRLRYYSSRCACIGSGRTPDTGEEVAGVQLGLLGRLFFAVVDENLVERSCLGNCRLGDVEDGDSGILIEALNDGRGS